MRRLRSSLRGQGKWALLCSVALGLIVAPFAVAGNGDVMKVGSRNVATSKETRIIGTNVTTYATRQSNDNQGDGGAATYGCRSALANEACVFVYNVKDGRAFDFRSKGNEGGRILVYGAGGADANKPFTTNATGVATGLNADRVDGQNAADFQARTLIAAVSANGTLDTSRSRGVTGVQKLAADGTYRVDLFADLTKCGWNATETTNSNAGAVSAAAVDSNTLEVVTRRGGTGLGTGPTDPEDKPFNVVVNC